MRSLHKYFINSFFVLFSFSPHAQNPNPPTYPPILSPQQTSDCTSPTYTLLAIAQNYLDLYQNLNEPATLKSHETSNFRW